MDSILGSRTPRERARRKRARNLPLGQAAPSSLGVLLGPVLPLLLTLLLPLGAARAADVSGLSDTELLEEARAAVYLGYLDANRALPEEADRPSALELIDALLDRPDLAGEDRYAALDLKLRALDGLGRWTEGDSLLAGVSSALSHLTPEDRTHVAQVWRLRHLAAMHRWPELAGGLQGLQGTSGMPEALTAEVGLLRAKLRLATPGREAEGFRTLVGAIIEAGEIEKNGTWIDPDFARTELIEVDYLRDQALAIELLDALQAEAAENPLARRRWIDLAAPSLHPGMPVFAGMTPEQTWALNAKRVEVVQLFQRPSFADATSGLRAIARYAAWIDFLYQSGLRFEIEPFVRSLPAQISGVPAGAPEELWEAHKLVWETLGAGSMFDWDRILANEAERAGAVDSIPIKRNLMAQACLVGANTRTKRGAGLHHLAKYLGADASNPQTLDLAIHEMQVNADDAESKAFYDALASFPNSSEARAFRAMFGQLRGEQIDPQAGTGISEQCLRDAAEALNLTDARGGVKAIGLRGLLIDSAGAAAGEVLGEAGREALALNWEKSAADNPSLAPYTNTYVARAVPAESASERASVDVIQRLVSEGDPESAGGFLQQRSAEELRTAIASFPQKYRTDEEMTAAGALLEEILDRGQTDTGLNDEEWKSVRVRHAEMQLCDNGQRQTGKTTLQLIAAESDGASVAGNRARAILEALSQVQSPEAYWWGSNQMTMAWEYGVKGIDPLARLLGESMLSAYDAGLVNITGPMEYIHMGQIGRALFHGENYADSIRMFTGVMEHPALVEDSEPFRLAEMFRIMGWERRYLQLGARSPEAEALIQSMIDTIRSRGEAVIDVEYQRTLDRHGLWAARQTGNENDLQYFESRLKATGGIPS